MANLQPRQLFIIDGLGAMLSALLLGVVLVRFESFFGIPKDVLFVLAAIPLAFLAFDGYSIFFAKSNPGIFLRAIATANIGYCLLSLVMAWQHKDSLTPWGWAYLIGEIGIVLFLARLELKVARQL